MLHCGLQRRPCPRHGDHASGLAAESIWTEPRERETALLGQRKFRLTPPSLRPDEQARLLRSCNILQPGKSITVMQQDAAFVRLAHGLGERHGLPYLRHAETKGLTCGRFGHPPPSRDLASAAVKPDHAPIRHQGDYEIHPDLGRLFHHKVHMPALRHRLIKDHTRTIAVWHGQLFQHSGLIPAAQLGQEQPPAGVHHLEDIPATGPQNLRDVMRLFRGKVKGGA